MRIRCNACGAEYRVADEKVTGRTVRVRCRACQTPIPLEPSQPAQPARAQEARRQEGSGLIDIRAMAMALGSGEAAPGPADPVAVSAQPSLPATLPTAGVIMPVMKSDRPWWLVPSLALGGVLLITVVALLAVLLLQPATSRSTDAGDPLPGAAASNGKAPAGPVSAGGPAADLGERVAHPTPAPGPAEDPKTEQPEPQPIAPAVSPEKRRAPRRARPRKRRPRRDPAAVARPKTDPAAKPRAEPRHRPRPRSISEILVAVGKPKVSDPKAKARPSLPSRLKARDIRRGLAGRLGAARACGRRFSTTGRVSVRLVVNGATGGVVSVTPKGSHASSQTGRCVARVLRPARFKRFSKPRQSFYFTVILR